MDGQESTEEPYISVVSGDKKKIFKLTALSPALCETYKVELRKFGKRLADPPSEAAKPRPSAK